MEKETPVKLINKNDGPFIHILQKIVIYSVKCLAVLMVFAIWLSLVDVIIHLIQRIGFTFENLFTLENLLSTLGDFLIVLIAIEIFLNIIFFLQKDVIQVSLVLSTALTAIARKVIILDYQVVDAAHILAIAAVILALGLSYWLIIKKT